MGREQPPGGRQQTLARVGVALMVICVVGGLVGFARIGGVGLVIAIIVVGLAVGALVGPMVIGRISKI